MGGYTAAGSGLVIASMLVAGCAGPEAGMPAPESMPAFTGRWAATDALCGNAAWAFAADALHTPGGVSCTFTQVTRTHEGYDIVAVCTAEGPPETERIRLSYDRSTDTLLVGGGPFDPVGLVACDG